MAFVKSIFDLYLNSFDNIKIFLLNVSPYYVFSVLVSIVAVFVVCFYRSRESVCLNKPCANAEPQATYEPDEEPEHVIKDELKPKTAKFMDRKENLKNEFPDSLITEEFVHEDLTETLDSNLERVSPEDAPGGDGNFKQQKEHREKMECLNSDEEVDSSLPNPMSRFKKARQAAILERVTYDMSEEQMKEEKEAEASQIAAIWDLLKQQKEQFNIGTEQELQDQLHLYCL